MDFHNSYQLWADSHVFYDKLRQNPSSNEPVTHESANWWNRLINDTPNGGLLVHNAMFDALQKDRKLHLLHVTHSFESINNHGMLYPSGGCLIGSVYCAPLAKESGAYRMHNLGEYILNKEAPSALRNVNPGQRSATPLIIELTLPQNTYRGLAGVDYLRLGEIHFQIYRQLEYLLSKSERHRLNEAIITRIKNSSAFLSLCNSMFYDGTIVENKAFFNDLTEAIDKLPILGYLYFEIVSEYLMLYSTSQMTAELQNRGELNNWLYKEMLFGLFPGMAGKFNLSKFHPKERDLDRLLPKIDPSLSTEHMLTYVKERMVFLVNARLFAPELRPKDWHRLEWDFNELRRFFSPLMGHLIHRELRSFGRYPEFYFYFDQYKALQAWNYWNHMDIVAPFNGTMPKGEIGINPAYPDLKYKIYRGQAIGEHHVVPIEELDLKIAPRLIDLRHTLMRNANNQGVKRVIEAV